MQFLSKQSGVDDLTLSKTEEQVHHEMIATSSPSSWGGGGGGHDVTGTVHHSDTHMDIYTHTHRVLQSPKLLMRRIAQLEDDNGSSTLTTSEHFSLPSLPPHPPSPAFLLTLPPQPPS